MRFLRKRTFTVSIHDKYACIHPYALSTIYDTVSDEDGIPCSCVKSHGYSVDTEGEKPETDTSKPVADVTGIYLAVLSRYQSRSTLAMAHHKDTDQVWVKKRNSNGRDIQRR